MESEPTGGLIFLMILPPERIMMERVRIGWEHHLSRTGLRKLLRTNKTFSALLMACGMVFAIGVIDSTTGPELSLSIFYLFPILVGSYYGGVTGGLALSLISIIAYMVADKILSIQYSTSAVPYWNAAVRLLFFAAVAYVVAKRKQAEDKLLQSEERFRLLVDGAKEYAILMLDTDGHIASWNAGAERTYGFQSEEILGKHVRSLYSAEEAESKRPEEDLQQALEKGEVSFEAWRARKDGTIFWADIILTRVSKSAETIRGYALLTRDITDRKKAEKMIRTYAQLHEVDRAILAASSSDTIAREALQHLIQLIPCKFATVTRFDMELGQITFIASEPATGKHVLPPSLLDGVDYEDLDRLKDGVVESVKDLRIERRPPLAPVLPFENLRSYIIVPLLSQANFVGSVNLGSEEPNAFSDEHLQVAREVSNQMALALQNADLFEHLRMAHQRLQLLNQKLLHAQEMEKHHLARELHDEVGQALTALRIHLEEMDAMVKDPGLTQKLSESSLILERILKQIRTLSVDLRPLVLDDLGLVAALRWYASSRSQLGGFSVHFEPDSNTEKLAPEIETVCFRVAQEALTNIIRHANAKHVRLDLHLLDQELFLSIKDDGDGFDIQQMQKQIMQGKSFGILGMKERIALVGGDFEMESVPGCGTEVRVKLPVKTQVRMKA
jgi:PAS domain S-box-containing protein